jgi:nucleotide-binding universal stress UspA family protein
MMDDGQEAAGQSRVVLVGIDGSRNAQLALRWACDDVVHHGGRVQVVHAWHTPHNRTSAAPQANPTSMARDKQRAQAVLQQCLDDMWWTTAPINGRVVEGTASDVILSAAKDADLLVIGSLGVDAGKRVVLGSVASRCAMSASCPVLIVPVAWRATWAGSPRGAVQPVSRNPVGAGT